MTTDRKATGAAGEAIARSYLEGKGYDVLDLNWRKGGGELDLVALDGEILVFIEVKTRHGESFGVAESGISLRQGEKLMDTAAWYLQDHPEHEARMWRIDLVAITLGYSGDVQRITHIDNAVQSG